MIQFKITVERRLTRDARVPLTDDDPEMENGWQCIEVPPNGELGWLIDKSYDSDRKTGWYRYVVEADDGKRLAFLLADGSVKSIGFCGRIETHPSLERYEAWLTRELRDRTTSEV
jgi:hypothetical protein